MAQQRDVDLAAVAGAFGDRLHSAGVPITPERSGRFAAAVSLADPRTLDQLYWAGRVTLVSARTQVPIYDTVFGSVFRGLALAGAVPAMLDEPLRAPHDSADRGDPNSDSIDGMTAAVALGTVELSESTADDDTQPRLVAISPLERLAEQPFDACTADELALIGRLVEQLMIVSPLRRGRRTRRHPHGHRIDVRATLRRSRSTGGDPVHLVRRRRVQRPRRVVLIADVSGSMQSYARVYLHLMRGAVRALPADAFVFSTRLTRLTRALRQGTPDAAYRAVTHAAPDWAGGTRIGRALTTFLDDFGRRGMARGAVVVIVSDGWEVDEADLLGEAMRRLHRLAYHVIWVNPRAARAAYQPLVGGMAAALPYVDTFVSGHSLRALDDVLAAIGSVSGRQRERTTTTSGV